ncbi:hypothetical protein [Paenibacillus sp. D51F]
MQADKLEQQGMIGAAGVQQGMYGMPVQTYEMSVPCMAVMIVAL